MLSAAKRIDGFEYHEALAALDYCVRNVRCCWLYLNEDVERHRNTEYSEWKLKDARKDLRRIIGIVRAFRRPHLKLVGEN